MGGVYAPQYIYLLLSIGVHNQKSLEPAGPKVKSKAKVDARMPAAHPATWRLLYRNKAAELQPAPRVCLSPLFSRRYLMRGQEAYGDLRHRAKASANLPARCCRWGNSHLGLRGEEKRPLSPSSHCIKHPFCLSQQISRAASCPALLAEKSQALFLSACISEECCVPSARCSRTASSLEEGSAPQPSGWKSTVSLPAARAG